MSRTGAALLFLLAAAPVTASAQMDPLPLEVDTWHDVFREVEVDFQDLLQAWKADTVQREDARDEPLWLATEQHLLLQLQEAAADLWTLESILATAEEPLLQLESERVRIEEWQGLSLSVTEELEARVVTAHETTARAYENLLVAGDRAGLRSIVERRIQGWWDLCAAARAPEAFKKGSNHQALESIEGELEGVFQSLDPDIFVAWRQLRLAASDEHQAALDLHLHNRETRTSPGHLEQLAKDIAVLSPQVVSARKRHEDARKRVLDLQAQLEALRGAEAPGGVARPQFLTLLQRVNAGYSHLQADLDFLPGHVSSESWCQVHFHGGLAALLAGDPGALFMLRTAAAARNGICLGLAAPYMDRPLFQTAWAQALFLESAEPSVPVALYAGSGVWNIDGFPVFGRGTLEFELRAGLHRLEADGGGGGSHFAVEDLRPYDQGEKTGIWLQADGIKFATLPPGLNEWSAPTPTAYAAPSDDPPVVTLGAVAGRTHFSLGSALGWLRLDGRDHWGGELSLHWTAITQPTWQWRVGVAHDTFLGSLPYRYSDSLGSTALLRERLVSRVQFLPQHRLHPGLAVSVGVVPPLHAMVADVMLSGSARLSARVSLEARAGINGSWWAVRSLAFWQAEHTGPEPVFTLGLDTRL